MCSWNGHYCWPGTCAGDLTKGCTCASDFTVTRTGNETSCQPTKSPSILTCDSTISIGNNGDKKQALSNGSSTICNSLRDVYGNLQPSSLEYNFLAEFTIDYSNFSKPDFIKESNIGVTDATIYFIHKPIIGKYFSIKLCYFGTEIYELFSTRVIYHFDIHYLFVP